MQGGLIWTRRKRLSNASKAYPEDIPPMKYLPKVAVYMGRRGYGIELNPDYFRDGVGYLQAAEMEMETPTLFDFMRVDEDE